MKIPASRLQRCPLCNWYSVPTVRWQGMVPVFVGYVCNNQHCKHTTAGGGPQLVGIA
jgi:hypothetical protein